MVALPGAKDGQMGRVVVTNHVTLDGVMQGPGRPDEDTRGGFAHGGWAFPRSDDAIVAKTGERMGRDRAFLFGRRTYEQLLASWNAQGGPFKDALNNTQSTSLRARRVTVGHTARNSRDQTPHSTEP
jgi:dihydrofolate reductase